MVLPRIVKKSSGSLHTISLDEDGNVWSSGDNKFGQRGINKNDRSSKKSPKLIKNIPKISDIDCGQYHTLLLDIEGFVWSFGKNAHGQLGLGHKKDVDIPKKIPPTFPIIVKIKCSGNRSMLIDRFGNVWSFGSLGSFQIPLHNMVNSNVPLMLEYIPKTKDLICGNKHTIILDINDNLWSCGENCTAQLGHGDFMDRYVFCKIENLPEIYKLLKNNNNFCGTDIQQNL